MAHLAAGSALFGDLKSSQPFFLMAGPNVIQSEEHIFAMCRELKRVTDELDVPFIFKSSFDKANRTSITSFRGRHEKYSIDARRRLPDRRRRYALAPTTSGLGGRGWRGGFGRLARAHPNHRSIVRRGWCRWTFYGGSQ
jgi:hypothetical protein